MVMHPLALLPVVTISGGQARLAPQGFGASAGSGTPEQAIASWVSQGAFWIHLVDDDARTGAGGNHHHVVRGGAHLQYSGGVRDEASLAAALATGASRIVLDVDDLDWAKAAVAAHGDRVAAGLDIRQTDAVETALALKAAGCGRFVVTDNVPTHHWKHEDRHLLEEFCTRLNRPVMARGGIHHLGDLHALHEIVPHGLDGIIIDDALYDGSFAYSEAMAAGADRFDMFFWGPPE